MTNPAPPDDESGSPMAVECQVWLADLSSAPGPALLTAVERERQAAFRQEADRARFATGATLLRLVVAARTGIAPERVTIDRRCPRCAKPHGKPQLPGTGLHASVSHSGEVVAVALTAAAPVGVDVEQIRPGDIKGLAGLCLSPSETVRDAADFFTYWCRKESAVKATGDGLLVPLAEVVVSGAAEPPRLISYAGERRPAIIADLKVRAGYAGAVTVLAGGELAVTITDAAPLLAEYRA